MKSPGIAAPILFYLLYVSGGLCAAETSPSGELNQAESGGAWTVCLADIHSCFASPGLKKHHHPARARQRRELGEGASRCHARTHRQQLETRGAKVHDGREDSREHHRDGLFFRFGD
jgi:hypothetical protein